MATLHCLFASDLHGRVDRYRKLFACVEEEKPEALFLGGDLLPMAHDTSWCLDLGTDDFVRGFLLAELERLAASLRDAFPRIYVILGNDDPRAEEPGFREGERRGLWQYAHGRRTDLRGFPVYGYAYVPPTPFRLKDWERYDVSRFVDPGCISPEEGVRSVPVSEQEAKHATIENDLEALAGDEDLERAIMLFHSPPYKTNLDRAALDGKMVDHAPVDVHVGSIAIRRFIGARQPLVALHGHIHESARITGSWRDRIGRTRLYSAAHDGPELALVRFDPHAPDKATRALL